MPFLSPKKLSPEQQAKADAAAAAQAKADAAAAAQAEQQRMNAFKGDVYGLGVKVPGYTPQAAVVTDESPRPGPIGIRNVINRVQASAAAAEQQRLAALKGDLAAMGYIKGTASKPELVTNADYKPSSGVFRTRNKGPQLTPDEWVAETNKTRQGEYDARLAAIRKDMDAAGVLNPKDQLDAARAAWAQEDAGLSGRLAEGLKQVQVAEPELRTRSPEYQARRAGISLTSLNPDELAAFNAGGVSGLNQYRQTLWDQEAAKRSQPGLMA